MTQATHRRRTALVCSLALAGCGGDARDRARDAEPIPLPSNQPELPEPEVVELPPGGVLLAGVPRLGFQTFEVDEAGVIWLLRCSGVMALKDGEARLYDARNSPLPERIYQVVVDAQNRKWFTSDISGDTIVVLEGGEWRTALKEPATLFLGASASGAAWAYRYDPMSSQKATRSIRQIAPALGDELALPPVDAGRYLMATDHDGAVWLRAGDTATYRWANGAWNGPFSTDWLDLNYDARRDVLWTSANTQGNQLRLVRWTEAGIEERVVRGADQGKLVGFGPGERQLWQESRDLSWVEDGTVVERLVLPATRPVTIGPAGKIYFATDDAVYEQEDDVFVPVLNATAEDVPCP